MLVLGLDGEGPVVRQGGCPAVGGGLGVGPGVGGSLLRVLGPQVAEEGGEEAGLQRFGGLLGRPGAGRPGRGGAVRAAVG